MCKYYIPFMKLKCSLVNKNFGVNIFRLEIPNW